MSSEIRAIRPGVLVSLKTRIRGNVKYQKRDIEYAHTDEYGYQRSAWETHKIVFDPAEQTRASQVCSRSRYLVARLCASTDHGLLCPDDRVEQLNDAIAEARALAAEFNASSVYTSVEVNVVRGRVVADDMETARAIFAEQERFLQEIAEGLQRLDVKEVRAICKRALSAGQILSPNANATVKAAVAAARGACNRIVEAGEQVAVEIDQATLDTISMARNSFLDFDFEEVEVEQPTLGGRAVDFDVEEAS